MGQEWENDSVGEDDVVAEEDKSYKGGGGGGGGGGGYRLVYLITCMEYQIQIYSI